MLNIKLKPETIFSFEFLLLLWQQKVLLSLGRKMAFGIGVLPTKACLCGGALYNLPFDF